MVDASTPLELVLACAGFSKEIVMSDAEKLYTETLQCLNGYPGAQLYAKLCCKLPNFYFHAHKQELAYEVLAELVQTFHVTSDQALPAHELMWHIAKAWKNDRVRGTYRKDMDRYMSKVATQLLISVTDQQKRLPQ